MSSIGVDWDPEDQWVFPSTDLTEEQTRDVISRVVEIGLRTLFENFTYKFANEHYQQKEGGPIGMRATGSAAELVMQDWSEEYLQILLEAKLWVPLLTGYVDDGRQATTALEMGTRFNTENKKFE